MKLSRMFLALGIVVMFCTVSMAAEYWVVKDKSGKLVIVEAKPSDESVVVKGPFKVRDEAEAIVTQSGPAGVTVTPANPPAGGTVPDPAGPAGPQAPPAPAPPGRK